MGCPGKGTLCPRWTLRSQFLLLIYQSPWYSHSLSLAQIVPMSILIGLIVPVPFWLIHQKYPKLGADKVITPILCWTLGYLSVGINTSVFTTFLLAVFSQYYLRRYRPRWFRKYNFLMSAALDGGTQVMVFIYTFAVGGGSGKVIPFPQWALVRFAIIERIWV